MTYLRQAKTKFAEMQLLSEIGQAVLLINPSYQPFMIINDLENANLSVSYERLRKLLSESDLAEMDDFENELCGLDEPMQWLLQAHYSKSDLLDKIDSYIELAKKLANFKGLKIDELGIEAIRNTFDYVA